MVSARQTDHTVSTVISNMAGYILVSYQSTIVYQHRIMELRIAMLNVEDNTYYANRDYFK